jgi:hypothetical protein
MIGDARRWYLILLPLLTEERKNCVEIVELTSVAGTSIMEHTEYRRSQKPRASEGGSPSKLSSGVAGKLAVLGMDTTYTCR